MRSKGNVRRTYIVKETHRIVTTTVSVLRLISRKAKSTFGRRNPWLVLNKYRYKAIFLTLKCWGRVMARIESSRKLWDFRKENRLNMINPPFKSFPSTGGRICYNGRIRGQIVCTSEHLPLLRKWEREKKQDLSPKTREGKVDVL